MMWHTLRQISRLFVAMVTTGVLYLLLTSTVYTLVAAESIFNDNFDVKPGGQITTVERKIGRTVCGFTYAVQGGTDEEWQISLKASGDDEKEFTCAMYREGGTSYLFFQQFKMALKGADLEEVELFGTGGTTLDLDEYIVDKKKNEVSQVDGKFQSNLSRVVAMGTRHKKRKHHKPKKEL